MSPPEPGSPAGTPLDGLVRHLAAAGFVLGVTERLRLEQAVALVDVEGDPERLAGVVAAVVVHDPARLAACRGAVARWLVDLEPKPAGETVAPPPPPTPRAPRWWPWVVPVALVVGVVALWAALPSRADLPIPFELPTLPRIEAPTTGTVIEGPDEAPLRLAETRPGFVLEVTPPTPPSPTRWPHLALLVVAAAAALWLWLRARRPTLAAPTGAPLERPRLLPAPASRAEGRFIEAGDAEALAWGIGQVLTDEPTERLDLSATLAATLRNAGLPTLHYEIARHPRVVWLWIDEDTARRTPEVLEIVEEIRLVLRRAGLPVQVAWFWGLPDRLTRENGAAFAPHEVEDQRDAAIIALLSDGALLTAWRRDERERRRVEATLRGLAHWPRLAWADFGETRALSHTCRPFELQCVEPAGLVNWLADLTPRPASSGPADDLTLWAAACAFAPEPVSEADAFELRKRLKLNVPPWAFSALRRSAPGPAHRLAWPPEEQVRLIAWLAPQARLEATRRFWQQRFDQAATGGGPLGPPASSRHAAPQLHENTELYANSTEAGRQDAGGPRSHPRLRWHGGGLQPTPAAYRQAQAAWCALFGPEPEPALATLARLRSADGTVPAVQPLLDHCLPTDLAHEDAIPLPWKFADLSPQARTHARAVLKGLPAERYERSGRTGLAAGLAAGLAVAAAINAWQAEPPPASTEPPVLKGEIAGVEFFRLQLPDGRFTVTARARRHWQSEFAVPGSTVTLKPKPLKCRTADAWSCGERGDVPTPDWDSQTAIIRPTADEDAQRLAARLLDTGAVDQVMWADTQFGPLAIKRGDLPYIIRNDMLDDPRWSRAGVARVRNPDWRALIRGLGSDSARPIKEVWPEAEGGVGVVLPTGCYRAVQVARGVELVWLCGGEFTMGDDDSDYEDERPAHRVRLDGFWMARTETTNGQYRAVKPGHNEDEPADLPASRVTWQEAQDFCAKLSDERFIGRLPTEAEWEYACRAGTTTEYSFGDDPEKLSEYAWFSGNTDGRAQKVAQKKPNPWGLYDLHGNVWEWVGDFYGDYKNVMSATEDVTYAPPEGFPSPPGGAGRVLRGGSAWVGPELLRSADRDRVRPEVRSEYFGFRCVRSPRR